MQLLNKISGNHIIKSLRVILYIFHTVGFLSVDLFNRSKMDFKENPDIVVMRNSITFLRICFLFPSKAELENPEKNVFTKFTIMYILASFYPLGVVLHLVINIKSKSEYNVNCDIFYSFFKLRILSKVLFILFILWSTFKCSISNSSLYISYLF